MAHHNDSCTVLHHSEQFATEITASDPHELVQDYIATRSAELRKLDELRSLGWKSKKGDEHFKKQRLSADQADYSIKRIFFTMMCQVRRELHNRTQAFTPKSATNRAMCVLDICMAPRGFSSAVLESLNGKDILLNNWKKGGRIQVYFADVTMLAAEMGVLTIPSDHPDALNFRFDRPFSDQKLDLIFCDGQVLRTHQRADYREKREAWRLLTSQPVVALQRITQDGTVVALLHRLDAWDTVVLLHALSTFSTIELFKPKKKHAVKSSFYVVAKNIQPHCIKLNMAVAGWKKEWHIATFGTDAEYAEKRRKHDDSVCDVLGSFGDQLVTLGAPIWQIQSNALLNAPFMR